MLKKNERLFIFSLFVLGSIARPGGGGGGGGVLTNYESRLGLQTYRITTSSANTNEVEFGMRGPLFLKKDTIIIRKKIRKKNFKLQKNDIKIGAKVRLLMAIRLVEFVDASVLSDDRIVVRYTYAHLPFVGPLAMIFHRKRF